MVNYQYWAAIFSCFLLFNLVFLGQKSGVVTGSEPETGLLLFVIPGFIASYLASKKCLLCPLLGALYALPFCLIIRHFWLMPDYSLWQELAYVVSAVFWCVFGALLYLFIRAILHALQQLYHQR